MSGQTPSPACDLDTTALRPRRFTALIMLDPPARGYGARGHPGRPHACCLIQPGHCTCFPAAISCDGPLPRRPAIAAVVTIALTRDEAEAFFAPGQRLTIWADALAGHTIRPDRPVGHGVIWAPVTMPAPGAHSYRADAEAAGPHREHGLAAQAIPAASGHSQRLVV